MTSEKRHVKKTLHVRHLDGRFRGIVRIERHGGEKPHIQEFTCEKEQLSEIDAMNVAIELHKKVTRILDGT